MEGVLPFGKGKETLGSEAVVVVILETAFPVVLFVRRPVGRVFYGYGDMGFFDLVLLSEGTESIEDGNVDANGIGVVVDVFSGVSHRVFLEDDGISFEVEFADLHTVALGCPGKDIFNEHAVVLPFSSYVRGRPDRRCYRFSCSCVS